jgi:capsular polysaccharide biosynthesis protein
MLKWRWHLIVIFCITVILSIVFSGPFFIKPKYKSFAVLYPSNIAAYSEESTTEQMLQLLKSEDMLLSIVKKFKLYEEYNVDTTDRYYRTKIIAQVEDNLIIRKTEYESVVIEVFDENPHKACDMVNDFIDIMNLKARELQRSKTAEVVKINHDQMADKLRQIDSIENRLMVLRKDYNILDYNIQVKEYSKGYVKGIASGKVNSKNEIATTLDNLKSYGGEFKLLDAYLLGLIESYNKIKTEYDKSLSDMSKELTYANIVTKPVPAEKKSYPVRWLIVGISSISALLLSLMLFSFIGARKKTEEITQ